MDQIDKLLAGIDALREFKADIDRQLPNELVIVPPVASAQGVREFLSVVAGPGWAHAHVISYPAPGGVQMHLATLPCVYPVGIAAIVVMEALDGTLCMADGKREDSAISSALQFLKPAHGQPTPEQAQAAYKAEHRFIERVSGVLAEVGHYIEDADEAIIKPGRKKWLLDNLIAAQQRLQANLDDMLKQ